MGSVVSNLPTKIGVNQHDILHQMYPDDCCLCKAEARANMLDAFLNSRRLPQRQDSTNDQLLDVMDMANRMGCYDAADIIRNILDESKRPKLVSDLPAHLKEEDKK